LHGKNKVMKMIASSTSPVQTIDGKPDAVMAPLLGHALEYARRGWSIIAVAGKKAIGLWKPFQARPADEKTLRRLFARKDVTGIAVITGKVSGGLVCRDFDVEDSYFHWSARHSDLAKALPTVETCRGFHVYFRGPEVYADLSDGEYRGDAKHYNHLPPSRHPSASIYRWTVPLQIPLPELDPFEAQPGESAALPSHRPERSRDHQARERDRAERLRSFDRDTRQLHRFRPPSPCRPAPQRLHFPQFAEGRKCDFLVFFKALAYLLPCRSP
jgi:hypothetical protein